MCLCVRESVCICVSVRERKERESTLALNFSLFVSVFLAGLLFIYIERE